MTWSTRCAAVSAIRRPPHDGHIPRDLQENATTRSNLQVLQAIRRKPRASTPQSRNDRNSFSMKPGHLPLVIPLDRQKRFQLASHDLIEERLFGIARPVGRIGNHEGSADARQYAIAEIKRSTRDPKMQDG